MRLAVMCCTLLLCIQLNAQTTFTGYYVTTNNDTIKGSFPRYAQWSRNPDKVEFLFADNSKSLQLTPSNSLAFSIDNYDLYISYSGKRLLNPMDDDVAINNTGSFYNASDVDTSLNAFLRLVIKTPRCEIYVYNDCIRTNFYYLLPGNSIQELKFKKYFSEGNIHELTEYRDQLKKLFAEEISKNGLRKKLEDLSYSEEGFEKFIGELFQVKNSKPKTQNSNAGWTLVAGVSINFLDVTGDVSLQEVTSNYSNSISPFLSVGYMMPFSRNFNRFFIYPQLRAYNYKNSGSFSSTYTSHVNTYHSQLGMLPEFNIGINIVNKSNLHFFSYAGTGMLILVKNRETNKRVNLADGSESAYDIATTKMTYSFNFSAGASIKDKFMIVATYNIPTSVANFASYTAMHSNLQFGFGYKFK